MQNRPPFPNPMQVRFRSRAALRPRTLRTAQCTRFLNRVRKFDSCRGHSARAAWSSGVPFAQAARGLRNPELHRVWAIFDWDQAGWQSFVSDPEVPAIFQEAGFTQRPPESAESLREHEA